VQEEELTRRAATLKDLQPHLENKIIVDVTNIGYLIDESQWGQTSSMILNMATLEGLNAKWTCAWKHVGWVSVKHLARV
jgi:hypothetical protein